MPNREFTKHTIWLRPGDMDKLKEHFPRKGASAAIRQLVSNAVDRLEAADTGAGASLELTDEDLDI